MNDTINYGIDLGTTNSVIAVARSGGVEIVKNNNSESTPSMVTYDKRGGEKVGDQAKSMYGDPKKAGDVQAEFKRIMGLDRLLHFEAAGFSKSPEQLSAAVLAELRRAAEERFGKAPTAAVITVPAMFELPQNEATATAARLADFTHSQLLQEPVAAAIAYGMEPSSEKALWMVYDYGGGTFDTSLISVRDGALSVVRHGGDNYLGGADFDWAIVDEILLPAITKRFDLGSLRRHDASDRTSVARLRRLKSLAEKIKMNLSRSDSDIFYFEADSADSPFAIKDDSGKDVELDIRVTREQFDNLIRDAVEKSVSITESVIRDAGYKPGDIEKVLMVGGSTLVPLVRERVARMGIPVSLELDPMTVVARGAAVFASTQVIPSSAAAVAAPPKAGSATVSLEFERVTKNASPLVGGKVTLPAGKAADTRLTITREDQGFTSGGISPDAQGMFFTQVQIRPTGQSVFTLDLRGPDGNRIPTQPEEFAITNGLSVGKATLPMGFSLALADGSAKSLAASGASLPAKVQTECRTSRELRAKSEDQLIIPFLSGDEPKADHNKVSTQIVIKGSSVSRDLPRGTRIGVRVHIDESGVPHPVVSVEMLDDEEFEPEHKGRMTSLEHEPAETMRERLAAVKRVIVEIREKSEGKLDSTVTERLRKVDDPARFARIDGMIKAWASGDDVSAGKAAREIVDLTKEADELHTLVDWPAKVAEFRDIIKELNEMLNEVREPRLREAVDIIESEGKRAIDDQNPKMLENCIDGAHSIRFQIAQSDPAFWAGMLQFCAQSIANFPNQAAARELLSEGAGAMRRNDSQALQSVCRELMGQLPREVAEQANRSAIRSDVM